MKKMYALLFASAVILAGCSTEAKYTTKNVSLSMEVKQVSCGFCEVLFHTDKDAYYYVAVEKVREGVDPMKIQKQFMTLSLDYAYKEYINWRFEHLYNGESHIAEFSSHSLQYGEQDYFFTELQPDTDYWIYCFVVDPSSNSPSGDLVLQTVRTESTSKIKVNFEYRINGIWDYIYPLDESGQLIFYLPWVGETVDEIKLREIGAESPGKYFTERFASLAESDKLHIFYGMYAHENNGEGDGTSETVFEEGHTYYTALASFDGPLIFTGPYKNYNIYKFTWTKDLKKTFTISDDTLGNW